MGHALLKKQFSIVQVYSKTKKNTIALATKLNAEAVHNLKQLDLNADLYILAVSDDQIKNIAQSIYFGSKLVLHTSGSVDLNILKNSSSNYGVLYPLQTIKKTDQLLFDSIPILIEANNSKALLQLKSL